MIGRVVGANNVPISDATASAFKGGKADVATGRNESSGRQQHTTGTDGIFQMCSGMFHVGDSALVRVFRKGLPPSSSFTTLADTVTVLPLIRDPRRP